MTALDERTPKGEPDPDDAPCGEPCSVPGCPNGSPPQGTPSEKLCVRDWYTPHADHWCAACAGHGDGR